MGVHVGLKSAQDLAANDVCSSPVLCGVAETLWESRGLVEVRKVEGCRYLNALTGLKWPVRQAIAGPQSEESFVVRVVRSTLVWSLSAAPPPTPLSLSHWAKQFEPLLLASLCSDTLLLEDQVMPTH